MRDVSPVTVSRDGLVPRVDRIGQHTLLAAGLAIGLALGPTPAMAPQPPSPVAVIPGMPPVPDPANLYSETTAEKPSPAATTALPRIYVPNLRSNDVHVIDPATRKVVDRFRVGQRPQHVVPSYDLTTLWVTNNAEGRTDGSLTPIDPTTGRPGKPVPVDDPYNMYFTPDGRSAVVVAEALKRLDFRDSQTMALQSSLEVPGCAGINHADFAIDGRFAIFTCEYQGQPGQGRPREPRRPRLPPALEGRDAAGHSHLAGRSDVLRGRHAGRRGVPDRRPWPSRKWASSRPASGRMGSTRAATARSSTSPTGARPTCTGVRAGRAA